MRLSRRHRRQLVAEISVTPLLDLVFILLFAFMVALPLVSRSDALLGGQPPSSSSSSAIAAEPQEIVSLRIHHSGELDLEGEFLSLEALEARLRTDWLVSNPDLGVRVEVPPEQPVSKLAEVMTMLARAGVRRASFKADGAPS